MWRSTHRSAAHIPCHHIQARSNGPPSLLVISAVGAASPSLSLPFSLALVLSLQDCCCASLQRFWNFSGTKP